MVFDTADGQRIEMTGAAARDLFEQMRALFDPPKGSGLPYIPPPVYVPPPIYVAPAPCVPGWWQPFGVGDVIPNPFTITCDGLSVTASGDKPC
ncbi:MAG TPA: hypothetical protein DCZ11_03205 [Gammaproteobacteria bacterium]|nr:hypothetical protein [Gammaproteobacteria bacterium]MCH77434.1 hypothetical protein [Gammaproteobacteria bacterium]